jgi:predicted RNase H-like HicB family nuclease
MRYAVVIEKASSNYAGYVPGSARMYRNRCQRERNRILIREAIEFHLEGLKADGLPIPLPSLCLGSAVGLRLFFSHFL